MSDSLKRYQKRIRHEFEFNGETYQVRGLTNREIERSEQLENKLKNSLFFGFGLLTESGEQEFTPETDEQDAAFAERVRLALQDVPLPTMRKLIEEIVKTTMPPADNKGFVKNSEATAT